MNRLKSGLIAVCVSVLSASPVSAQSIGSGTSDAQQELIAIANEWIFYTFEASSVSDIVLFFVAPLFGFYMINKNMFSYGLESFEERIDRDNYSRTNDEIPNGLKGAALAVSFITVQVLGMFSTIFLLITGVIAGGVWVLSQAGLIGDFDRSSGSGGSESSSDDGGDEDMNEMERRISALEDQEDQVEDDEENSDVEAAEHDLNSLLNNFEGVEGDLKEMLEHDEVRITNIIHNLQQALNDNDVEVGKTAEIGKYIDRLVVASKGGEIPHLKSEAQTASPPFPSSNFKDELERSDDSNPNIYRLVEMLDKRLDQVIEGEHFVGHELEDQMDQLIHETHRIRNLVMFLDELDRDLSEIKQDEQYLKQMVDKARDKGLLDDSWVAKVRKDEEEMRKIASALEDLEGEVPQIVSSLQNLHAELKNKLTVPDSEMPSSGAAQAIETGIDAIINKADSTFGTGSGSAWDQSDHKQRLGNLRDRFKKGSGNEKTIRDKLVHMKTISQRDGAFQSGKIEELENLMDQMGISY